MYTSLSSLFSPRLANAWKLNDIISYNATQQSTYSADSHTAVYSLFFIFYFYLLLLCLLLIIPC